MRLARHEIVAPLGAGGMGEVYRARDTRLERDVKSPQDLQLKLEAEFSTSGVFLTELTNVTDLSVCSSGNSVTPTLTLSRNGPGKFGIRACPRTN